MMIEEREGEGKGSGTWKPCIIALCKLCNLLLKIYQFEIGQRPFPKFRPVELLTFNQILSYEVYLSSK
jgi:hypothetical protein